MPNPVQLDRSLISDPSLSPVADKVERGERLSDADGVALFASSDLIAIGHMADRVNLAKNGTRVTFAANQHINPTNICTLRKTCVFCSYARLPKEEGAYRYTMEQVYAEAETANSTLTREFHIVGGLDMKAGLAYYSEMFRGLKARHPHVVGPLTANQFACPASKFSIVQPRLDLDVRFGEAFEALSAFRGVSIAAVNGYAMGGGLECVLACDLRIAEEQAQLALPEATVGLLPGGTGTQALPWLVGEGWAKRMILLGERVDANTALRIGLVEEIVPSGQALAQATQMAQRVGNQSPDSVLACKQLIHAARNGVPRAAALALEREHFIDLFNGPNQREGVNAFLEKRKAVWK